MKRAALVLLLTSCTVTTGPEDDLNTYGQAVAREYAAWVSSPAYAAWVAAQPSPPPRFGYTQDCRVFSKLTPPPAVKSCVQGPGLTDGPTIKLELQDCTYRLFDASKP